MDAFERSAQGDGIAARAAARMDTAALREAHERGYRRRREDYYLNITYPSLQTMGPISEEAVGPLLVHAAGRPVAVYVHVPFCSAQCAYCHYFKVFRPSAQTTAQTVQTIVDELTDVSARLGGLAYRAIYIGGGTPSYLPIASIRQLFAALDRAGIREPGCETSFEVHPENATAELFAALKDVGVTRISMGVESLEDTSLARENRRHTVQEALDGHELARSAGFRSVNLDLIYGMEGQGLDGWTRVIERLRGIAPDSVTAYQLRLRM